MELKKEIIRKQLNIYILNGKTGNYRITGNIFLRMDEDQLPTNTSRGQNRLIMV